MSIIQDYRRTDLRVNKSGEPFWIISKAVDGNEVSGLKDKACVLFSFPVEGQQIIIHEISARVIKAFTSGTTLTVGTCTLANNDVSTNDTATVLIDNALIEVDDITPGTAGYYYPTSGDFVDSKQTGVLIRGGTVFTGASTDVPAIAIFPKVATILEGQVRVAMLVSVVPEF